MFYATSSSRKRGMQYLLAGACVTALAVQGTAGATGPRFASGGGQGRAGGAAYTQFAFSAQEGPEGASGHISLAWPDIDGQVLADVTCVEFLGGGRARITGRVTKETAGADTGSDKPHQRVLTYVKDSPDGDTIVNDFDNEDPSVCGSSVFYEIPLLSGNVLVKD